ncbi:XRE family transcriptional regulator [bacterium 1XD42-1]|nr:XRE family transcriptional regulator [bacterium 1XD42-8]RKJ61060.1 XRE family transcriptional regulator [bacterium 1XD42-1]
MSIGSRLKEARKQKKFTQEELAARIGITKGAIANYENQVSTPKIEILFKLIQELGVDANYIYQDYIKFKDSDDSKDTDRSANLMSVQEALHLKKYRQLNIVGRKKSDEHLDDLLRISDYIESVDKKITQDAAV